VIMMGGVLCSKRYGGGDLCVETPFAHTSKKQRTDLEGQI